MFALLLAAGRGERLRPLTDTVPKPLLKVGPCSLIEHRIHALARAGIKDLVINTSYRGDQIRSALGDGSTWEVRIRYSNEPDGALETGGGILQALDLLHSNPFWVVNSDIWCEFPFPGLTLASSDLAHLVLVDTPSYRNGGDFALQDGRVRNPVAAQDSLTFSGIGLYRHELFAHCQPGRFPLAPILRRAAAENRLSGEHYPGPWADAGTPQRLSELRRRIEQQSDCAGSRKSP